MRRLLATTVLVSALPGLVAAQDRPSLLDYFSPDILIQRVMQSGIMALRTQLDMKYSAMAVDLRTGSITITDVVAWPLPEWDLDGTCEVGIDRLTLRSGALDEYDRLRFKAQITGVSFPPSCLPDEPRGALAMAGLDNVEIPRLTIDVDYGMPSSDATIRAYADITDVAVADLTAELSYVWFDGREDMEEPVPVVFLESATLALENRGIWDALKGQLPPPFVGDGAGQMVEGMVAQGMADENPEGAGLTEAQNAFVKSLGATWPAFLANPETLVLQTNLSEDGFVDFEALEDDFRTMFDTFQPILSLAPARLRDVLPLALLQQGLGAEAGQLSAEDRKRVGTALVTGVGAPRNTAAGLKLLGDVARGGDGDAAMVLATALQNSDPAEAYRWALVAGSGGAAGATAMLDRLERNMPFGQVLDLQNEVSGGDANPVDALAKLSATRDEAARRFSGRGQARSYELAAMWAMIATAAGDPEASDILAEIDERVRLSGASAQAAWAGSEATASKLATEAWVSQDLASRFGK